jgi:hypothetical protein
LRHAIILASVLLLSCSDSTDQDSPAQGIEQLEQQLELQHHRHLLARMAAPGSTLAAFTTDGCSGGLSIGWEYLAEHIDSIRKQHGMRPTWEDCCIAHDRRYHAGAIAGATAADSFEARKQADLALEDCVIETGARRSPELSDEYGVSVDTIHSLYATIAGLMYRAVRVGGIPCSGLPWRWGYGWPACSIM